MALNINPELIEGRLLQNNLRAVERHLTDDHYIRGFTPGDFTLDNAGNATFVQESAAQPRWPTINMPDGVTSQGLVSWRKPSEWRTGLLRLRYWYTSDVGSTNNFYIQTGVYGVKDGQLLNALALLAANTAVVGPAVAYTTIRSAYIYTTTPFTADTELFSLRIQRIGADANDTNVNDFALLYAEVEHIPAVQEAT